MSTHLTVDPPAAVAIARCLLARERAKGTLGIELPTPVHEPCAWCTEDDAYLNALLADFNREAFDERRGSWRHPAVDTFRTLPAGVQAELVRDAAGEPATPAPPENAAAALPEPPADAPVEDWFR